MAEEKLFYCSCEGGNVQRHLEGSRLGMASTADWIMRGVREGRARQEEKKTKRRTEKKRGEGGRETQRENKPREGGAREEPKWFGSIRMRS